MMEQLAEHGVTAEDLVPSLLATYTVDNPEYDPEASNSTEESGTTTNGSSSEEKGKSSASSLSEKVELSTQEIKPKSKSIDPFGQEEEDSLPPPTPSKPTTSSSTRISDPFDDYYDGDIGGALGGGGNKSTTTTSLPPLETSIPPPLSPTQASSSLLKTPIPTSRQLPSSLSPPRTPTQSSTFNPTAENLLNPLPSSLPGVSTTLTSSDKTITLDIRWTILCDLFLSLIADSVYDARSRVLLGKIADRLGLEWMDVVRFERRLTEALEIQEGVQQKEHGVVLEDQRKKGMRSRYVMMGLATLG